MSSKNTHLPVLYGVGGQPTQHLRVRELKPTEIPALEEAKLLYSIAQPTMTMFGVASLNFEELDRFIKDIEKKKVPIRRLPLDANRLLFNYVAAADAFLAHFQRIYKQQCRATGQSDTGFDDLLTQLREQDDAFEFFLYFRGHVIHAGLPIGSLEVCQRGDSRTSVSITQSSDSLLSANPTRKFTPRMLNNSTEVDLWKAMKGVQHILSSCVFNQVVTCFRDSLKKAQAFYRGLADEVMAQGSHLRPYLRTDGADTGGNYSHTYTQLPIDLAIELGIEIVKREEETQ